MLGQDSPTLAANVVAAWRSGGFTEVRAGAKLPKLHYRLCGATPAIVPNRALSVVLFCINMHIPIQNFLLFSYCMLSILRENRGSTLIQIRPFCQNLTVLATTQYCSRLFSLYSNLNKKLFRDLDNK
jgi:hypothetical protein